MVGLRNKLMATAAVAMGTMMWGSGAHALDIVISASVTCGAATTCDGFTAGEIYMLTTNGVQGKTSSVNWTGGSGGANFAGVKLTGSAYGVPNTNAFEYPPEVAYSNNLGAVITSSKAAGETLTMYVTYEGLDEPLPGTFLFTTNYGGNSGNPYTAKGETFLSDSASALYNNGTTAGNCAPAGANEVCNGGVGDATGATGLDSSYSALDVGGTTIPKGSNPSASGFYTVTGDYSITTLYTVSYPATGVSTATENLSDGISVPEPASLSLLGSGLLVLGMWRRRRSKSA